MDVRWGNRQPPHTSLLWKLGCHGNQSEISRIEFIFGRIEFIFGMEIPCDNSHQPHTSFLW